MSDHPQYRRDIVELSPASIQHHIDEILNPDGLTLVLGPQDERLQEFVPVVQSNTLATDADPKLDIPEPVEYYLTDDLPVSSDDRVPYPNNHFDHGLMIFSKYNHFGRINPFLELTRVVDPNGTILTLTGLCPADTTDSASGYHDAKFWVPTARSAAPDRIIATRVSEFQTPRVIGVYTDLTPNQITDDQTTLSDPSPT